MKKIFSLLIIFLSSIGVAQANSSFTPAYVDEIIVHDSDSIIIKFTSDVAANEGCVLKNQMILRSTHARFDRMYPALLSAFYSGKKIGGWVNGCGAFNSGSGNYPMLNRLDLKKD